MRLPATYVIGPGGALSPPTISAPASVQVDLTAISGDGRSYTLRLVAPGVRALSVPAGGRASASIAGLKDGAYAIDVDGARRGALVVGVSPGP